MTVCGQIETNQLGKSSMHDHVLSDMDSFRGTISDEMRESCPINVDDKIKLEDLAYLQHGYYGYSAENWDLKDFDLMKKEVAYFKERGGDSILEPSAPGISHDISLIKKISDETKVNIIASTGLYVEPTWPEKFLSMDTDQLTAFIQDEVDNGIRGTDIKPGHIKSAIRRGTDKEYSLMRAAARVSNETGLSITAHTSRATHPDRQRQALQTFIEEGVDTTKLVFCHIHYTFLHIKTISEFLHDPSSLKVHLDWSKEIMDAGGNICVDLFGTPLDHELSGQFHFPDIFRLLGIFELIKAGYEDQIVVGTDIYQKAMTRTYGGHGYARILDFVAPQLLKADISQEVVDKILIHNPARILSY